MLHTSMSGRGMVTAPHHLAAQSGLEILREGGNAIEAMTAAAATIAVVYPHMNSIGGDGFWLIAEPGKEPIGVDACGGAAKLASAVFYKDAGHSFIPFRGPLAALTVAGTISGWAKALEISSGWKGRLPLSRLLADAIEYADAGVPMTAAHCVMVADKASEMTEAPGFEPVFLSGGLPSAGQIFKNKPLAAALQQLTKAGLDDFYRGGLARSLAADLESMGSPLRLDDFEKHRAKTVTPLSTSVDGARIFNLPPPTQGLASLLILAFYNRMRAAEPDGFDHIHRIVECTKRAFKVRDYAVMDPDYAPAPAATFLTEEFIGEDLYSIDLVRAAQWPDEGNGKGDTIWMGAIDAEGRSVSFIQSLYWEFGSGAVLPATGINWQNRGTSFSLDPESSNPLMPGKKPFHTLNPAFARFSDGRAMVYGTMGGDGQPQTQAAVFSRYAFHGQDLQQAVTAPRWLLGRTWGSASTTLKLESRFSETTANKLKQAGHNVEMMDGFTSTMGHAGAIVLNRDGVLSGAADPRSDGSVAAF